MGRVVYGSELAEKLRSQMKDRIELLREEGKRIPCLAVILVGDDPASLSYVKGKEKACAMVGLQSEFYHLDESVSQQELEEVISSCNQKKEIDGILVQLPLPKGLDEEAAIQYIRPEKDVDGLHPMNVGKLYCGLPGFVPCTPLGVMEILKEMGAPLNGRQAVVLGRSKLVGAPVARLLQNQNATVTICHSKTIDLPSVTRKADILVVAIGKPKFVTKEYVKEGAYVVDVGIHRQEDGHLVGDVDFADVVDHTTAITPVPKGVGPMTICMLLHNTIQAYEMREASWNMD